jgi:predicted permease
LVSVNEEVVLTGLNDPIAIEGRSVTANFFAVLGVNPAIGRTLVPEDDRPGAGSVIVVSDGFWRSYFGGDPARLGTSIVLDGKPHTIVGVMPAGFEYPRNAWFWAPLSAVASSELLAEQGVGWMFALGRLRPGVGIDGAAAELTTIWRQTYQGQFDVSGFSAVVTPFEESVFGSTRPALLGVLGAVSLLLLIACVNVAGLHAVRTTERRPELAVHLALGASRSRAFSIVFAENVLLAILGCAGGMLVAMAATPLLVTLLPPETLRLKNVRVGPEAVALGVVASILASFLSGIASYVVVSRVSLRHEDSPRITSSRNQLRSILVVAETVAAVTLLFAAGLTARSFIKLSQVPLGFDSYSIITMKVSPRGEATRNGAFYRDLLDRVRLLPGVEAAAAITQRPLWNTIGSDWVFTVEGQSESDAERNPMLNLMAVSSDYFRTMGIPIRTGRPLTDDDAAGQPGSVVLSESLARLWPGQNPIGKRIKMPLGQTPYHNAWLTVVGIAGDARYRELHGVRLDCYISYLQADHRLNHLMIRTQEPAGVVTAVRNVVRELDKNLPVTNATTMAQIISEVLSTPALVATLFSVFAVIATGLAGVGLYGLLAYAVAGQTREIGVRMALGAVPADILTHVARKGALLAMVGGVIGIATSIALASLMSPLVFGVSVHDPISVVIAVFLLVSAALVATIFPALRAARVDPLVALRYE